MSVPENNIAFKPAVDPTPDPYTPTDPLAQAEAMLARFAAGGWLLTRGNGGNGSQADNRAVLDGAIMIALAYEIRVSAEMICAELRRIAAALEETR